MRAEIENKLNSYFQKRFKNETELVEGVAVPVTDLYELVAKPRNVDMDSPEVQRLLMRITAIFMTSRTAKYINLTQLYNPVLLLCKHCREDAFVAVLEKLWTFGTIGLSIPDLERKVSRGGKVPMVNGKRITFDQLNFSFKQVEQQLDKICFSVCVKNNIRIPFDMAKVLGSIGQMEQQG